MRYNNRDFRERPPRSGVSISVTILISVTVSLLLVISVVVVFVVFQRASSAQQATGSTTPNTGITQIPSTAPQGSTSVTVKCLGYEKTDPEIPDLGKTVTFPVTVTNGCDVIVQGVVGKNVGPYNWDNGAVAALGPGSYSFTITDGSYQMASDANAQTAYCNAINWIQTHGKALSQVYPLSGWGSC